MGDPFLGEYVGAPEGPRPGTRIALAEAQLQNLAAILEGEEISVGTVTEVDADIGQELIRKRSWASPAPKTVAEDKRVRKVGVGVIRPSPASFDHNIETPWFRNKYQFSYACPRDTLITLGNTILEAPTPSRVRYFESNYWRDIIYRFWDEDKRIHWRAGPQPTCADSMYDSKFYFPSKEEVQSSFAKSGYRTRLNETQVI
jgi:hypothetical protein